MSKNLVIVESPAKAKTIEKYLGRDFTVLSSIGHICSIPKKTKDGTPPIDIKNGFKTQYEIDPEKKKTIAELKKAAKVAETIWLATDEDREGEAIAWHLCEVLKLDPRTTKRIVFHEITKSAIEEAVKNPRTVDMSLVEAQQARQILDRIVDLNSHPWSGKRSLAAKALVVSNRLPFDCWSSVSVRFAVLKAIFNSKSPLFSPATAKKSRPSYQNGLKPKKKPGSS
jgi:DNA topoisomerase IA